jgi:EAL domain-containing protein (putative c-di-GMP-specific phosphodiesterase class I)
VDFVKIDRDVVRNALAHPSARAVLLAIIAFAGEVGTYVIAEGIEDGAMLNLVRSGDGVGFAPAGRVHGAQGYLLGRPSPESPADRTDDLPAELGGELVA